MLRQSTYAYIDRVVESYQSCIKKIVVVGVCMLVCSTLKKLHNIKDFTTTTILMPWPSPSR